MNQKDNEAGVQSYDEFIRYGSGEEKIQLYLSLDFGARDENGKGRSLS